MTNAIENATAQQNRASDPGQSTFVSANAGSGKTTVLTARIARLLYRGARPENILCVTFTKAAAGEVQNRVFKQLGAWVLKPDAELRQDLSNIGETDISTEDLRRARRLFARAIETPSGLKIHTIHAFAASLLRRFPIEAGVSPSFTELSDNEAQKLRQEIMRRVALARPDEYRDISTIWTIGDRLLKAIFDNAVGFRAAFNRENAAQHLSFAAPHSDAEFIAQLDGYFGGAGAFRDRLQVLVDGRNKGVFEIYLNARSHSDDSAAVSALYQLIHTAKGELRANVAKVDDHELVTTIVEGFDRVAQSRFLDLLARIHPFFHEIVAQYDAHKRQHGLLDYDDLIDFTEKLLAQNDRINWVMYRLDSAIDHILVDEAQDTSAQQWNIVDAIVRNWNEGDDRGQTLFVVGDEKQSIFRFQGADPTIFERKEVDYRELFGLSERRFDRADMLTSFRSSPLLLDFVDAVFADELGTGLGGSPRHAARAPNIPGRIEIWPAVVNDVESVDQKWPEPVPMPVGSATLELARKLATRIFDDIRDGKPIVELDGTARPRKAGDYLILLRQRKEFFFAIQKELQKRGVAIAGVDRLYLRDELAVQDILALLRAASAPFDSFSLGMFLRSPMVGMSETALYQLAANRGEQTLEERLRASGDYHGAVAMLDYVRANADFRRPHDIIFNLLVQFDAEPKLRSRLGVAVADVLASLLDTALQYEAEETPSLVGFLAWFDRQNIEVKRVLDDRLDAVRVMTVHGAKGLEAPIVIYPFIESRAPQSAGFAELDGLTVPTRKTVDGLPIPSALAATLERARQDDAYENDRLLYVALTRAQSELLVLGLLHPPTQKTPVDADGVPIHPIYEQLTAALGTLGGCDAVDAKGVRVVERNWPQDSATMKAPEDKPVPLSAPTFARLDEPAPANLRTGLTSLLGDRFAADDKSSTQGRGTQFGTDVHKLLEILPTAAPENWRDLAADHLADTTLRKPAFDEAVAVFRQFPDLLEANWQRELPFNWKTPIDTVITGRIDAVRSTFVNNQQHIRVVDYKTDIDVATNIEQLNKRYTYQLAVYAQVMQSIYPQAIIEPELIWTINRSRLVIDPDSWRRFLGEFITKLGNSLVKTAS